MYGDLTEIIESYDDHADLEEQYYQDFRNSQDEVEKATLVQQIMTVDEQSNTLIQVRKEDILGLLDEMAELNADDLLLAGRLDLTNVGVMGYSFGGAAAISAGLENDSVKAIVNLDGWPYGLTFEQSEVISQPFMLIRSDSDDEIENMVSNLMFNKVDTSAYMLTVQDAQHENFWDFPLFFNIYKYIGFWGPADPETVLNIEDHAVIGFFDKYLKDEAVDLTAVLENLTPEIRYTVQDVE